MPIDPAVTAALPEAVRVREAKQWTNWHGNLSVAIDGYFDVTNPAEAPSLGAYNKTTVAIQEFLGLALDRGVSVRPFGGTWSFTDIVTSPGWMVDTAYLNWVFPMGAGILAGRHSGRDEELFFVQAGTRISQINRIVEKGHDRSLGTSGASNGQTLAGAIATGTHGSAIDFGGLQNHVVGVHLITGPDTHCWIERASDPATKDDRFANLLSAHLVRDDDLFNATLVSLGALGFVAGVMIETVPLFRLRANRAWRPYDEALRRVISTLDFSAYKLPGFDLGIRPYFFQTVVNPFDSERVSVTAMAQEPYAGETIDYAKHDAQGPGYELLSVIAALTDTVSATVPPLVRLIMNRAQAPFKDQVGTLGETFDFTAQRAGSVGGTVGVSLDNVLPTLSVLLTELENGDPPPLVFALRFVRPSGGTLEFTRNPVTCVVDLDGAYSDNSLDFMHRAYSRLETARIPFTQHWGKINNYDATNVRSRFGSAAVDSFLDARKQLLCDSATRRLFSTPFLERVGLAS